MVIKDRCTSAEIFLQRLIVPETLILRWKVRLMDTT